MDVTDCRSRRFNRLSWTNLIYKKSDPFLLFDTSAEIFLLIKLAILLADGAQEVHEADTFQSLERPLVTLTLPSSKLKIKMPRM